MEFRKLIGFGKSSYVISLPKSWTEQNKLQKGDVVYLNAEGSGLVLSAKEKMFVKEPRMITIKTDGKQAEQLQAEITAAYLDNYDTLEIKGFNLQEHAPMIKKTISRLAGLELLEQESTRMLARDLLDTREISIQAIIRKIDMILRSMIKDSMSPLHEDFYESIFHRDAEVNRLVFLVKRVIKSALADQNTARKLGTNPLELLKDWNVASLLESVGDEIKRIARQFKQIDDKHAKELGAINTELGEKYLELMKSYHTKNPLIAYSVELGHKKRVNALECIEEKTKEYATAKLISHMKTLEAHLKNMARAVMTV